MFVNLCCSGMAESPIVRRAFAAYFRAGGVDQPANDSREVEHGAHRYVVLRNVSGTLAVYRVRNDGMLRRMRRWPKEVERR